jgi:hypothetical protein
MRLAAWFFTQVRGRDHFQEMLRTPSFKQKNTYVILNLVLIVKFKEWRAPSNGKCFCKIKETTWVIL